jgi:hypothetical protein
MRQSRNNLPLGKPTPTMVIFFQRTAAVSEFKLPVSSGKLLFSHAPDRTAPGLQKSILSTCQCACPF